MASTSPEIHPALSVPLRYRGNWQQPFYQEIQARLQPGITILDVGSGRHPTLQPDARPPNTTYVGLDLSREELERAGEAAYDEIAVADLCRPVPALGGRVDLAVSWQVFEHVPSLAAALDNLHGYLRPGGILISLFSGKWSAFGVTNRLLPDAVGAPLVSKLMRRAERNRPVFPAFYNACSANALRNLTVAWSHVRIDPLFRGAHYVRFSRALSSVYMAYEDIVYRARCDNLATHYLMVAKR